MFENKKILILGFARSGYEAAKLLIKMNNQIILNDAKQESEHNFEKIQELKSLGIELIFGSHPVNLIDKSYDYLIKNPGVPIDHPYVLKAKELNIEVINEVELAYRLFKGKVKLIAITGTNGKTTTTTLIYETLKAAALPVHMTGNMGLPISGFVDKFQSGDIVVMEVSAQQLENVRDFKPDIAVMTNLSPAHLDFFASYDNYKDVKEKIFAHQNQNDLAILNHESPDVMYISQKIRPMIQYFSSLKTNVDCYLKDEKIYYKDEKIISINDIKLKGNHNLENIMAMIIVAKTLHVETEVIKNVLKDFKGVEHRLEFVREIDGRSFYNDSKATNPESTKIALQSFDKSIVLILGGKEANQNFNYLNEYLKNVRLVVCYGSNKNIIKNWLDGLGIYCFVCENLNEATNLAYQKSRKDEIILLSPASASWDQFASFEKRGELFKELVNNIEK